MTHKIFRQSLGRSLSLANLMKVFNIKMLPLLSLQQKITVMFGE